MFYSLHDQFILLARLFTELYIWLMEASVSTVISFWLCFSSSLSFIFWIDFFFSFSCLFFVLLEYTHAFKLFEPVCNRSYSSSGIFSRPFLLENIAMKLVTFGGDMLSFLCVFFVSALRLLHLKLVCWDFLSFLFFCFTSFLSFPFFFPS